VAPDAKLVCGRIEDVDPAGVALFNHGQCAFLKLPLRLRPATIRPLDSVCIIFRDQGRPGNAQMRREDLQEQDRAFGGGGKGRDQEIAEFPTDPLLEFFERHFRVVEMAPDASRSTQQRDRSIRRFDIHEFRQRNAEKRRQRHGLKQRQGGGELVIVAFEVVVPGGVQAEMRDRLRFGFSGANAKAAEPGGGTDVVQDGKSSSGNPAILQAGVWCHPCTRTNPLPISPTAQSRNSEFNPHFALFGDSWIFGKCTANAIGKGFIVSQDATSGVNVTQGS